ncbi:hypothetical protein L6452_23959 [Arctium lappa]|uniref:Uncharacterized protein n=1 Tax=Arctium lappa TaxID=4217 RepID=A0ACB9A8J5_ARCLA|nr:hypothetical protein L6452_23959 [Arctium lappa]
MSFRGPIFPALPVKPLLFSQSHAHWPLATGYCSIDVSPFPKTNCSIHRCISSVPANAKSTPLNDTTKFSLKMRIEIKTSTSLLSEN